jgi:hypothetical protein
VGELHEQFVMKNTISTMQSFFNKAK